MKRVHYAAAAALLLAAGCKSFDARLRDLRDCGRVSVGLGIGVAADVRAGTFTWPSVGTTCKTRRIGFEDRRICLYWRSHEASFPTVQLAAGDVPLLSSAPLAPIAPRGEATPAGIQALGLLRGRGPNTADMNRAREASARARAARNRRAGASQPRVVGPKPQVSHARASWMLSYKRRDVRARHAGRGVTRIVRSTKRGYWLPWHPTEGQSAFHDALDFEVGATLVVVSARVGVNPFEILDFVFGFFGCDIAQDDGGG